MAPLSKKITCYSWNFNCIFVCCPELHWWCWMLWFKAKQLSHVTMCVWGIGLSGFCVWFGCYMHLRCPCFILGPGSILLECLWSPCRKFVAMTIIIIIPWRSSLCHMILIIMSNDDYRNIIHEDDFPTREQFNFPTRMQNNFLTKVQENFPTKMQRNFPTRMY